MCAGEAITVQLHHSGSSSPPRARPRPSALLLHPHADVKGKKKGMTGRRLVKVLKLEPLLSQMILEGQELSKE